MLNGKTQDEREMEVADPGPFDERTYKVEVLYKQFVRGVLRDMAQDGAVSAHSPEHAAFVTFLAWKAAGHKRVRIRVEGYGQEWDITMDGKLSDGVQDDIDAASPVTRGALGDGFGA